MRPSRTVAIVGSHPATRAAAPFDDPNVEIWAFNEAANQDWCKRADVVFQLHLPVIYRSRHNRSDPKHWEWLQSADPDRITVLMQAEDPLVPASARYPLREVCAELLSGFRQGAEQLQRRYFTSSIAYALALAIYWGYRRILVYGVEMASNTEYSYQRDCVAFWTGLALGRDLRVEVYSGDGIFDRPLYGYEGAVEACPDDFDQRAEELRADVAAAKKRMDNCVSALSVSYNMKSLSDRIGDSADAATALGEVEGRLSQVERYGAMAAEMWQLSGTAIIDRNEYEGAASEATKKMNERAAEVHRTAGRLDIYLDLWQRTKNPAYRQQVAILAKAHLQAAHAEGIARGVMQENTRLAHEIDRLLTAAGGAKALQAVLGGE